MTEVLLGASLAIYGGVSPSRLSPGVARRLKWARLADVLLDDRQRRAAAGDGEIGGRPQVSAHAGADTNTAVFAAHGVGGAAFESLGQNGNCQGGWIGQQKVDVVGFAVELHQLDVELGADRTHGVLAEGEHLPGEHPAAILRHENKVGVQQRHAVSGAAVGLGCQRSALGCGRADG